MDIVTKTNADSFVAVLRERAALSPEKTAYIFLKDGEVEESRLTYAELDRRARTIAAHLQLYSVKNDRALLLFPPGLDYVAAFYGCLYAGVIAVPAYPPHPARLERTLPRLKGIAQDSRSRFALTTSAIREVGAPLFSGDPVFSAMTWIASDTLTEEAASGWQKPDAGPNDLAFLQYTSGSTGAPKGAMVSHGNLLVNSEMIHVQLENGPQSIGICWLPLYHDMGLIGGILQSLYVGFPTVLMAPAAFLQKPFRWLKAISDYRGTQSPGPNFSFDLCVRKITPEQKEVLDLSCWEMASNGAEPVRPETLKRFAEAFSSCGFRTEAFYPCYGLAEATLFATGGRKAALPVIRAFQKDALKENRAVPVPEGGGSARVLVGNGSAPADLQIAIVDPQKRIPCSDREIGEIWIAGPSVTKGYWQKPEVTRETFDGRMAGTDGEPFLRTGDLGFMDDGELFVTGRRKDLIIIRGRNHYPQDIEKTVEGSYPLLRPGCSAAFSVEIDGEERLVIAAEVERRAFERRRSGKNKVDRRTSDRRKEIVFPEHEPAASITFDSQKGAMLIRQAVSEHHELSIHAILFLKVGTIPKTTSGKIQRHACRIGFIEKSLDTVGESVAEADNERTPDRDAVLAASPEDRESVLIEYLKGAVASATGILPTDISPDHPFSHLGLDSLMAVELQHRLETELGLILPMTHFLEDRSLRAIATEGAEKLSAPPDAFPADPGADARGSAFPLSANQRALWFLYQMNPQSAADNIYFAGRLAPGTDLKRLQTSFDELVRRHPSLRTTYGLKDGSPMQIVREEMPAPFELEDAAALPPEAFDRRLSEAAHRPFDLKEGPVMKITIFDRGPSEKVLLMVIHHIAVDLWSLSVLLDDLRRLYSGEQIPPAPALSYGDFVRWQAALIAGPAEDRLFSYWRRRLEGVPVLDLPTDRPRPPVQRYRGSAFHFRLDPELSTALRAFARANNITLYMALLSAFNLLLHRYSGQTDIPVGTLSAGRSRAGFETTVGYFINMLVMRSDLSGDPTVLDLADRVRKVVMEGLAHHDYPFQHLLERLHPKRDTSRSPLFQTMFILQRPHRLPAMAPLAVGHPGARIELGENLVFETLPVERQVAQFDLQLTMAETDNGLPGTFEYNTDLFDAETIARMAEHFRQMLKGIVNYPNDRISQIPILSPSEENRLIREWNRTEASYPGNETVIHRFAAQAARTPDRTAVICGSTRLSYRGLNEQANRIAHFLREGDIDGKTPIGPENRVGLLTDRSERMIIGMLGILKAGAAYVPIDPDVPRKRIRHIVADSNCRLVLTDLDRFLDEKPEDLIGKTPIVDIRQIRHPDSSDPAPSPSANQLAYVIYTSGSTGTPKGVALEHRHLFDYVMSFTETFAIGPEDRVLQQSSITFDASVEEIYPALLAGAELVVCQNPRELDALLADLTNRQITVASLSPAAIGYLNARAHKLSDLRLLISGGDVLRPSHIDRLIHVTRVVNTYGPTETTVCATFHPVERLDDPLPIGKPLPNRRIYILDAHLRPVPVGVPGEICIGGRGTARGYLNRSELTAERFIPNPFRPGERLYRSGDMGKWLPHGDIVFLGRNDFQVKIRGFRIETGEIETVLESHPGVQQAVVVDGPDPSGDRRLIAYVASDADPAPDTGDLRAHLRQKLPEYMIPAVIMLLPRLPMTPGGKVDRAALPAPDRSRREAGQTYRPPATETERQVAALWAEVLDLEKVGVEDNFFDIGGHSLLIVAIQLRLETMFKREIPIVALFQHPTVSLLSRYLDAGETGAEAAVQKARDRGARRKAATRRQQRIREERSRS